jgi:hypothetical protein
MVPPPFAPATIQATDRPAAPTTEEDDPAFLA